MNDKWDNANSYESYIGRWSRLVAPKFVNWLNQDDNLTWLDVGCGTGALSDTILQLKYPERIIGIDPSESHIQFANEHFRANSRTSFLISDAANIPLKNNSVDVVTSGLALNFIEDIKRAISEFKRVSRNTGTICGYVWDYLSKMEMIRYFWDTAISLDKNAKEKDEAVRFPLCNEDKLRRLFLSEGLRNVEIAALDVSTVFVDFNDFWNPFLSGQAPAPGYCKSSRKDARQKLNQKLFQSLPIEKDGSIHLIARAISIKALVIKD